MARGQPRIVKEHDERKAELMLAAEKLFVEKGYEFTSVEEIILSVNVAKGTFYHYFPSKERLLEEILLEHVEGMLLEIERLPAREGTAVVKLFEVGRIMSGFGKGHERIMDYVHEARNAPLHYMMEKLVMPRVEAVIRKIVAQGDREKVFDSINPDFAAETLIAVSEALNSGHGHAGQAVDPERTAYETKVIGRILGVRPGVLEAALEPARPPAKRGKQDRGSR